MPLYTIFAGKHFSAKTFNKIVHRMSTEHIDHLFTAVHDTQTQDLVNTYVEPVVWPPHTATSGNVDEIKLRCVI